MKRYEWIVDGGQCPPATITQSEAQRLELCVISLHREIDMGYAVARISPRGGVTFFRYGEEVSPEELWAEKAHEDYESSSRMLRDIVCL